MLELKKVDSQLIVELPTQAGEATAPVAVPQAEEALPILHRALKVIDENDLWGQLDYNSVRDYMLRLEPDFDEKRYGFAQFPELLTYAQDLGLVRLEPDANSVWRVFPGMQFTPTRAVVPPSPAKTFSDAGPSEPPEGSGAEASFLESGDESGTEAGTEPPEPARPKPRRRSYRRSRKPPGSPRPHHHSSPAAS